MRCFLPEKTMRENSSLRNYETESLKALLGEKSSVNLSTACWVVSHFYSLTEDEYNKYLKPYEGKEKFL